MNLRVWRAVFVFPLIAFTTWSLAQEAVEEQAPALWQDGRASVGIDASQFSAIDNMMTQYVDEQRVAGLVVSVAYNNEVVYSQVAGQRGLEDATPMKEDDLFRIYSMSKPIAAVALMQLYEEGKFTLDTRLDELVPEFKSLAVYNPDPEGEPIPPKNPITMLNLFTHTAGFGYVFGNHPVVNRIQTEQVLGSESLDQFATKVADIPLMFHPGTRWHYSLSSDVKGLVVERLSGMPFDEYLDKNIFEPLGMEDTFFEVPDEKLDRFLPNHFWNRGDNVLVQAPTDNSLASYRNVTFFSGGGGLVSTAHDYMQFARAVSNGGELDGVRILDAETVDLMRQNHLGDAIQAEGGTGQNPEARLGNLGAFGFGLGFGVQTGPSTAERSNGEYSWGGAAGTVFWIDPVERLVVVGMIQLMGSPHPLSGDLHKAVRGALVYDVASGE